jgi:hypothetical protein
MLFAMGCTALAVTLPAPAMAAGPSETITLEAYESVAGSGKFNRVKIPTNLATKMDVVRVQALEVSSNRMLAVAQAQNLALPKANGLLTRIWRPSLRSMSRGVAPALLEVGLIVGLSIATSLATVELSKTSSTLTMSGQQCAALPTAPSSVTEQSTGIYRNSNGTAGSAVQRTTIQSTSSGTVPAPSGWAWSYQRQIGQTFNEAGQRLYTWEVWFSKNVTCGERVAFPPTTDPLGSIPNSSGEKTQADQNSEANRVKVIDGLHNWGQSEQSTKPFPGGEIVGQVEEPGIPIPPASQFAPPSFQTTPAPLTPADLTTPLPSPVIDPENTHVKFPDTVGLPTTSNPGTGTGTQPSTGTGSGSSTPIDWGTPPADEPLPSVTPMSWFPTAFTAPDMPGQCSAIDMGTVLNTPVSLDPCPSLATVAPAVRPLCIVGATIQAGRVLLDI